MAEHSNFVMLSLVAIVAIVALVVLTMGVSRTPMMSVSDQPVYLNSDDDFNQPASVGSTKDLVGYGAQQDCQMARPSITPTASFTKSDTINFIPTTILETSDAYSTQQIAANKAAQAYGDKYIKPTIDYINQFISSKEKPILDELERQCQVIAPNCHVNYDASEKENGCFFTNGEYLAPGYDVTLGEFHMTLKYHSSITTVTLFECSKLSGGLRFRTDNSRPPKYYAKAYRKNTFSYDVKNSGISPITASCIWKSLSPTVISIPNKRR